MPIPEFRLRLTEQQHRDLKAHLFPGDGLEAVALILCGRREGEESHIFTAREIVQVPYNECQRRADRITWPLKYAEEQLTRYYGKRQALIKVHSHTADYRQFSSTDDISDRTALTNFEDYCGDGLRHGSAIMLPDGSMFGRVFVENSFRQLTQIAAPYHTYPSGSSQICWCCVGLGACCVCS